MLKHSGGGFRGSDAYSIEKCAIVAVNFPVANRRKI